MPASGDLKKMCQQKKLNSLLVLQNFGAARKSGNISYILNTFFVRHLSEYEVLDSDLNVNQNLYSQMWIQLDSSGHVYPHLAI